MEWITVLVLLSLGLALLAAEFIFVPGTTVVGIIGGIVALLGVYMAYRYFGNTTGSIVLSITVFIAAIAFYYSFNAHTLDKFALHQVSDSRVNDSVLPLRPGDRGITRSPLRPAGNAEFFDRIYLVTTPGDFIRVNEQVEVIRIEHRKIYVAPVKS